MANNTQHHIIKDSKRTADDAQLIQHTYTHLYTLFGGFGLGTEVPRGFVVNKNGFVFVCSPISLAATCKQESAFNRTNISADYKEASTCTLRTQPRKSAATNCRLYSQRKMTLNPFLIYAFQRLCIYTYSNRAVGVQRNYLAFMEIYLFAIFYRHMR